MGFLANLLVKIGVDTADLNAGMDKATRSVNKFAGEVESAGKRLSVGISIPLIGVGAAALKAAADMEQTQVAFTTLLKSADAAKSHLDELKKFALVTPFQFEDLTKASRLMQAYGFAASDVVPKLRIMGNAVSALGGGNELLERVVRSMGEIGTRGKITGEQLRELSRAGIPALDAIAKKLGVSVAEAQKQISAGSVDAKTAMDALLEYMETRFKGGMEAQAKTVLGSWSNIKDKITFTLVDIGQALLPVAKNMMETAITPLLAKIQELAAAFAKLPGPAQNTILGIAAAAAAFPLLTIAIGATITNAIAIGNSFSKVITVFGSLVPSISQVGAALAGAGETSLVNGFQTTGRRYAAMVGLGVLRTASWIALADAVYQVARAYLAAAEARDAAEKAGKEQEDGLLKLEISLKRQGADISEIQKQYSQGQIGLTQYLQGLRDIAVQLGKNKGAEEQHAVALVDIDKMLTDAGIKTLAQRKKDLEQAQALYAAVVKEYGAGSEIALEALEKVKQAHAALTPVVDQTTDKLQRMPFERMSLQAAVWVEQMRQGEAELHKFVQEVAAAGGKEQWLKKFADALAETDRSLPNVSLGMVEMGKDLAKIVDGAAQLPPELQDLADAMHTFGLDAEKADIPGLQRKFEVLGEALEKDEISFEQYARAYIQLVKAMDAAGEPIDPASRKEVIELERQYGGQLKETRKEQSALQQQAKQFFDSLARGIASSIVNWKGFGDTMKQIAKDAAQSILTIFIEGLFKKLAKQLVDLLANTKGVLGKIGGWLGGIFGGSGSGGGAAQTAGSAASAGASAAGSIGSSVSSVGGAAASSLAGWVNVGVSALSGIVSGIQGARTNNLLADIREHTLRIFNELSNFRTDAWTREGHLMLKLDDMWRTSLNIYDLLGRQGTSGKGGITFNNCNFTGSPNQIAAAIFQQAELAGAL